MVYSLNLLHGIYLQFSGPNLFAILEPHHPAASSHLNNDQTIHNARKLTPIAKTYGFNSLFEVVFVYIEALYRFKKKPLALSAP